MSYIESFEVDLTRFNFPTYLHLHQHVVEVIELGFKDRFSRIAPIQLYNFYLTFTKEIGGIETLLTLKHNLLEALHNRIQQKEIKPLKLTVQYKYSRTSSDQVRVENTNRPTEQGRMNSMFNQFRVVRSQEIRANYFEPQIAVSHEMNCYLKNKQCLKWSNKYSERIGHLSMFKASGGASTSKKTY